MEKVFGLEEALDKYVKISGDSASLQGIKDSDLEEFAKTFDVDTKNTKKFNQWLDWMSHRFNPVYLATMDLPAITDRRA